MKWKKYGVVGAADLLGWSTTHCSVPTPIVMDGVIRVYFGTRSADGKSKVAFFDFDREQPWKLAGSSLVEVLSPGSPGYFDENGVLPSSVVDVGNGRHAMFYVGFELGAQIRYRLLTGFAVSDDGGLTFHRKSSMPLLERSDKEAFFRCGASVAQSKGPLPWELFYVAGSSWECVDGKVLPKYEIVTMSSQKIDSWGSSGESVISIEQLKDEHGFGRPWRIDIGGVEYLFYSIRRRSLSAYRVGVALKDGTGAWIRQDDEVGINVGESGRSDSDAIMYMAPIEVDGEIWCYYNGNDFGRDGIMLAKMVEP